MLGSIISTKPAKDNKKASSQTYQRLDKIEKNYQAKGESKAGTQKGNLCKGAAFA